MIGESLSMPVPTFVNVPTDRFAHAAMQVSLWMALMLLGVLLLLVVRRDRDERRQDAVEADGRALTREIMAVLTQGAPAGEVFARSSTEQRLAAVAHLCRLLRGSDRELLLAFVEEHGLLDRHLKRARSRRVACRIDAARVLGCVGGPAAVRGLVTLLSTDPAGSLRLEAAAALARLGELPPAEVLIAALALDRTSIAPLHHALFRALAPNRSAELVALASGELPDGLRALVVDALGWTGDFSGLRAIEDATRSPAAEVRLAAVSASVRLDHPAAARWLMLLLDDGDEWVRAHSVRACASMGLRAALPQLRALRADPSPWVRLRARQAAVALGAGGSAVVAA